VTASFFVPRIPVLPGARVLVAGALLALAATAAGAVPEPPPLAPSLQVWTTAPTGPRLERTGTVDLQVAGQPLEVEASVFVRPSRSYQALLGIGGAITDASAEVFARLAPAQQAEFLRAYFDAKEGIGYTLARTTIHSSDFSSASYTYVAEGDAALATFSIAHDRAFRIPLIKAAIAAAGGHLTIFASPWSAPAFMKTNGNMLHGGRLRPEFADAWAHYVAKFVQSYEAEGIPIWGLTIQNEPMAVQTWESMQYTAEEERDFLRDHLGPVLRAAGLGAKKIIVWDHNRDLMTHRAAVIFEDAEASRYAWGLGFHWYETWKGGESLHANVEAVHSAWPEKHLLLTEATIEEFDPRQIQNWAHGERYGAAIIRDFNAGAEGWTDWNILLDERGGPNHVGNFCYAPVHADTKSGRLVYTPSYWYLGHFSKFIRPGAHRIDASSSQANLLTTAFRNEDGRLAVVVMNTSDKAIAYRVFVDHLEARVTIPAHGIQTLVQ